MIRLSAIDLDYEHAVSYTGGGMKIGLQLPHALKAQAMIRRPAAVYGTSCGALVAWAVVSGKVEVLQDLVNAIRTTTSWFRIPSVTSPALHRWRGLQSLEPLRKLLSKHWDASRMEVPLVVGVVCRETGTYHQVVIGPDTPKDLAIKYILASCAVSGLFEPEVIDGLTYCDGGHILMGCVPFRTPGLRSVEFVSTRPLYGVEKPTCKVDRLVDAMGWALDMAGEAALQGTLSRLRSLSEDSVVVDTYAPEHLLGTIIQADEATMQARAKEGWAMLARGPVRLTS